MMNVYIKTFRCTRCAEQQRVEFEAAHYLTEEGMIQAVWQLGWCEDCDGVRPHEGYWREGAAYDEILQDEDHWENGLFDFPTREEYAWMKTQFSGTSYPHRCFSCLGTSILKEVGPVQIPHPACGGVFVISNLDYRTVTPEEYVVLPWPPEPGLDGL